MNKKDHFFWEVSYCLTFYAKILEFHRNNGQQLSDEQLSDINDMIQRIGAELNGNGQFALTDEEKSRLQRCLKALESIKEQLLRP